MVICLVYGMMDTTSHMLRWCLRFICLAKKTDFVEVNALIQI